MRALEIMHNASAGASCAGGIAPVESALGMTSRSGGSLLAGKYVTGSDPTPNTPKEYKRNKDARRRFETVNTDRGRIKVRDFRVVAGPGRIIEYQGETAVEITNESK